MANPTPVQNNDAATGGITGKGFQPGRSGNPGGRAKGLARRIRDIAPPDKLADFYLAVFDNNLETLGPGFKVTLADRMKAGEWLAERGYGKAPAHAPIEDGDPLELDDVDREIARVVDELAARRKAQAASPASNGDVARNGKNGAGPA